MSDSWDPMDCSPPGSSVRGISQARILEWFAISDSGIKLESLVSPALVGRFFTTVPSGKHITPLLKKWDVIDFYHYIKFQNIILSFIMIWCLYILQIDHHNKSLKLHPSPHIVTILHVCVRWELLRSILLANFKYIVLCVLNTLLIHSLVHCSLKYWSHCFLALTGQVSDALSADPGSFSAPPAKTEQTRGSSPGYPPKACTASCWWAVREQKWLGVSCELCYIPLGVSSFVVVQLPSPVRLFLTPWTAAHQASLSLTLSRTLPKFMSMESVMASSHLILCHPLLLLSSIFSSIRMFSNGLALHIRWPKYWSFSINPFNEYLGLIITMVWSLT